MTTFKAVRGPKYHRSQSPARDALRSVLLSMRVNESVFVSSSKLDCCRVYGVIANLRVRSDRKFATKSEASGRRVWRLA